MLRNRRYTGDGGIDGRVWMERRGWHAVQIKRYGSHINSRHVEAFGAVVRRQGFGGGLFVHTGRSGAAVYTHLAGTQMTLVSGESLVRLVLERRLPGRYPG